MLVEVKCNLCGSDNFKVLENVRISPLGGESRLVRCKKCGLAYLNPQHEEAEERRFYASECFEKDPIEVWTTERLGIFKHNLKLIKRRKKGGRLLDLGCGMGQFIKIAKDDGFDVLGMDISKPAVEYARRNFGLEIIESTLKDAGLNGDSFDVVTAWNTIDQLSNPLGELKEIYRILKNGGIVAIRVPNVNFHLFFYSILKNFFRGRSLIKPPVFHNFMFSPKTAVAMLKKAGFENIAILNSRLSIKNAIIEKVVFLGFQILFYLTLKRYVMAPSLLIFARKD